MRNWTADCTSGRLGTRSAIAVIAVVGMVELHGARTACAQSCNNAISPATAIVGDADTSAAHSLGYHDGVLVAGATLADLGCPDGDSDCNTGSVSVYVRVESGWVLVDTLVASDPQAIANYGGSVDVSDDHIVVGASLHDAAGENSGAVYVYVRDDAGTPNAPLDDSWTEQARLVPSDGAMNDHFGFAVAINQGWVVVGSPSNQFGHGAVYFFQLDDAGTANDPTDDTWVERQAIISSGGANFGRSAVMDGPWALVGDRREPALAYRLDGNGTAQVDDDFWTLHGELAESSFGGSWSLDLNGDLAVLGALEAGPFCSDPEGGLRGQVTLFRVDDNDSPDDPADDTWRYLTELLPVETELCDELGTAVVAGDDWVLIGARGARDGRGEAYFFEFDGDDWVQVGTVGPPQDTPSSFGLAMTRVGDGTALLSSPNSGQYGTLFAAEPVAAADQCFNPTFVGGEAGVSISEYVYDGYIDPRQASDNGVDLNQGLDTISVRFTQSMENEDGSSLTADRFTITDTANNAPNVVGISTEDGRTVTIHLDRVISVGEWTTIHVAGARQTSCPLSVGGCASITIGFLPGDVDQNRRVSPLDLFRFRGYVIDAFSPPRGVVADFIDIDRDGEVTPLDLFRFRQGTQCVFPDLSCWSNTQLPLVP
jgi:FG-GAP repeat